MKKVAAAVCAAMFVLTGCGGGDDEGGGGGGEASQEDSQTSEAKENIKSSLKEQGTDAFGGVSLSDEQAGCMADGVVDEVGVEKLQEYKLVDADLQWTGGEGEAAKLSADDADSVAGVVTDCIDFQKVFEDQINSESETQLTQEQADCLGDALTDDVVRDALSAQLQGESSDPTEELTGALMGCVMGDMGEMASPSE